MAVKSPIEKEIARLDSILVHTNAKQRYQERLMKDVLDELDEARKTSNWAIVFSACSLALSLGLVASTIIF